MPEQLRQYKNPYFDSSVFIGRIKGEVCKGIDRKAVAEHNFRLAQQGTFRINTSSVTLAEVHKRRKDPSALTNEQDENILAFFEHEFINIIDVDREIGEQANRFCRQFGLAAIDAIHFACAARAGCDVLLARDHHFRHVNYPGLLFEEPAMLGQLGLMPGSSGA